MERKTVTVTFLDNSSISLDIDEDDTFSDLHLSLVRRLRQTKSVDLSDRLLTEFGLFTSLGSPPSEHLAQPNHLVHPVSSTFQGSSDRILFRRLVYPAPTFEGSQFESPWNAESPLPRGTPGPNPAPPRRETGFSSSSTALTDSESEASGGITASSRIRARSVSVVADSVGSASKSGPVTPRINNYKIELPPEQLYLWLEFCECVDIFANNLLYKPMVKELVELAALHLLIAVKKEGGSAKQRLKAKLEEFYPPRFASVMKPSVAMEQIAINFNDIKLISLDKAQQEYIHLVQKWRFYGTKVFFDCKSPDKKLASKPVTLGINEDGIMVMKKDSEIISVHPYNTIASWSASYTSFSFECRPDGNDKTTPITYSFDTPKAETISAVMHAYIDRKLRRLFDSLTPTQSLSEPSPRREYEPQSAPEDNAKRRVTRPATVVPVNSTSKSRRHLSDRKL